MLENKKHEELKFLTWLKDNGYVSYDLSKQDIFCGDELTDPKFIESFQSILKEIKFNKEEIKYLLNKKVPENIYFRGNSTIYAEEEITIKFFIFYRFPSFKILYNKIFKDIGFTFEELLDFYRDAVYSIKDNRLLNFSEWLLKDVFDLRINYQTRIQKRDAFNKGIEEFISYDNLSPEDIKKLSFEELSDRIFFELDPKSVFFIEEYINYFIGLMKERSHYTGDFAKKILLVNEENNKIEFDKETFEEIFSKYLFNNQTLFNHFIEREDYSCMNNEDDILKLFMRIENILGNKFLDFFDSSAKENNFKNKNIEDTDKFYKKDYPNQLMLFALRRRMYSVASYYLEKGYKLNIFEEKIIRNNKKALSTLEKYLSKELNEDAENFLSLLMLTNTKKNNDIFRKYGLTENDVIKIEESRQNNKKIPYNIKGKEDEILYYSPIIQTVIKSPEKTCLLIDKIELDEKENFLIWNSLFSEVDKDNENYRDKIMDYIEGYSYEIKKELAKQICVYLESFLWQPNKKKIFNFIGHKVINFCYELLVVDAKSTVFDKDLFIRMMTLRNVTNAKYLMYNIYPLSKYLNTEQVEFIFDNSLVDVFKVYEEGLKSLHSYKESDIEMMDDFKVNFTFKALEYLVNKGQEEELYDKMNNFYGAGTNYNYNSDSIKKFMIFFKNTMLSYQMKKNIKESDDGKSENQIIKKKRL